MSEAETKIMRYVGGKVFYTSETLPDGKRKTIEDGDLIALTPAQQAAFADKFEDPEILEKQVAEARSKASAAKIKEEEERQRRAEEQELARKAAANQRGSKGSQAASS